MSKTGSRDIDQAKEYEACKAKQFGNLHERMKFLINAISDAGQEKIDVKIWHAVFDLETEVKYHKPTSPPYGRKSG